MADLPAVLNVSESRLAFLAGRPGDFFRTMGEANYASVVRISRLWLGLESEINYLWFIFSSFRSG